MEPVNGKARWLRMRREQKAAGEISKEMRDEELRIHEIFVSRVWKVATAIITIILLSIIIPGITRADTEIDLMTIQGEKNG